MSRPPLMSPALSLDANSGPVERPSTKRYGSDAHLVYHEEAYEPEPAKHLRELIRPPVIRQWVEGGKIYREPSPREVPRVELFFDLLFVAVVHQLAEAAVEEPSGAAVARFVLTFWPSWSIWEEARKYSNVSGTDDLLHRVWILVGMICILGYSVNASAIELHPTEEEETLDHSAVKAAVAFWLIIKLSRVIVLFIYGWRLPKFRTSQFLMGLAVLVPMFVYFPLLWVTSRKAQITLAALGIVVDVCRLDLIFYNIRGRYHLYKQHREWNTRQEQRGERPGKVHWHKMPDMPDGFRIPAMNIEHAIDRSGAFVVIVLGELVMNLLYTATRSDLGASITFGRATLGLMVAWALNYLYQLPSDPNNQYEHALRRSWFTGVSFTMFHWPLCASLVLASAASGEMIRHDEVEVGLEWYWGCGLGFAVLFTTLIDLTHRDLAAWNEQRIPRFVRAFISFLGALALILFPLGAEHLNTISLLGIAVGITWFLVIMQIIGILPRWSVARQWEEQEREVGAGQHQHQHTHAGHAGYAGASGKANDNRGGDDTEGVPRRSIGREGEAILPDGEREREGEVVTTVA